jgi:hypothetical protein
MKRDFLFFFLLVLVECARAAHGKVICITTHGVSSRCRFSLLKAAVVAEKKEMMCLALSLCCSFGLLHIAAKYINDRGREASGRKFSCPFNERSNN